MLSICTHLGIAAKSASSSIEEPQAERVRRYVKENNLAKEPAEEKGSTKEKTSQKALSTKTGLKPDKPEGKKGIIGIKPVIQQGLKSPIESVQAPPPALFERNKDLTPNESDKTSSRPLAQEKSYTEITKENRLEPTTGEKKHLLKESQKEDLQKQNLLGKSKGDVKDSAVQKNSGPKPMVSLSGKPIPPPPRPLLSPSGKPIPPPPKARDTFGQRGNVSTNRSLASPGQRPLFSPTDSSTKYQISRYAPTTRPKDGNVASQKTTLPPRGRQPLQRRTYRKRRKQEEFEPRKVTSYVPSDRPVPDYEVIVERNSTAQELGPKLNRTAGDVVRFLLLQGESVTATQPLTDEMIELFAAELGAKIRLVDPGEEKEAALIAKYFGKEKEPNPDTPRPPIITVMGHVDHGKTLLLDRIRNSNKVAEEAGGITQHIGAYQIEVNNSKLTFIDTPGHEAFSRMRARGAQLTDIVVLVVAANDGVMPQTVEAINHAKAAGVPIVVAINKIDLEQADPNRVMQQLSEHGLVPEAWGGDTVMVPVSALKNEHIDELLESLVIVAELEELKCDLKARPKATVLESNLDVGRGPIATVIVKQGILKLGDPVVAGSAWGKVKAMINDKGEQVKAAYPSDPVQVLGLSVPPLAGDELIVTDRLADAKDIAQERENRRRFSSTLEAKATPGARLEDIFETIKRGEAANLNIVLKADVQGSLEAITDSLLKLQREDVRIVFVYRGVGGITESDVSLASASNAVVIGFNVRPDRRARELAEANGISIRTYEIIYQVIEDINNAILGLLKPKYEEVVTGEAEVREVFRIPKVGYVAGCYVRMGVITRGSKVRFLRDGVVIWHGAIASLKRFKDDVKEVREGFECGVGLSDFQDLKPGDIIETYEVRELEPR